MVCSYYRLKAYGGKAMAPPSVQIGVLAQRTGCNIETIRYYERIGLLPKPRRNGRYRTYAAEDVGRLAFVMRARELGFKLGEIRALLLLSLQPASHACEAARAMASERLTDVNARITDLRRMQKVLNGAIKECGSSGRKRCPIIDTLAGTRGRN